LKPKVTVIIPTYNRAHFIKNAVDSVLSQTYKDFELIVVDDGSTDNTKQILKAYRDKLHYVYQENQERAVARNKGIALAKGEYVGFLDSDDLWFIDKLARQVPVLDNAPENVVLTYGYKQVVDKDLNSVSGYEKKLRRLYKKAEKKKDTYLSNLESSSIFTSTILIRRKVLLEMGGYDAAINDREDYELYLRLLLKGYEFAFISNPPLIQYRLDYEERNHKRIDKGYLLLYEKHLELCQQLKDKTAISKAKRLLYKNIAQTYYRLGDFTQARIFWNKALKTSWLTLLNVHFLKQRLYKLLIKK